MARSLGWAGVCAPGAAARLCPQAFEGQPALPGTCLRGRSQQPGHPQCAAGAAEAQRGLEQRSPGAPLPPTVCIQACVFTELGLERPWWGGGKPMCVHEAGAGCADAGAFPLESVFGSTAPASGTSRQLCAGNLALILVFLPEYESKKQNLVRGDDLENTGKCGEETESVTPAGTFRGGFACAGLCAPDAAPTPRSPSPGLGLPSPPNPCLFIWSLIFLN